MANGTPDFRFKPSFDITGIADLLARKPQREEAIRASRQNRINQQVSQLMQAVELGSNLATQGLNRSMARQEIRARQDLSDTLEQLGNLGQQVGRPVSRMVPPPAGQEGPAQLQQTTLGQTPEGSQVLGRQRQALEGQLLTNAAQVSPGSFAQGIIQESFRKPEDPLDRALKAAKIQDLTKEPQIKKAEELFIRQFQKGEITESELLERLKGIKQQRITIQKGLPSESAGKLAGIDQSIRDLNRLEKRLIDKKGNVNRKQIFAANVPFGGFPLSSGRQLNTFISNAVETKLRLETGAAATPEEVERISERFRPKIADNDTTIKDKLKRLKRFMKEARFIIDPSGRFLQKNLGKDINAEEINILSDEELAIIANQ